MICGVRRAGLGDCRRAWCGNLRLRNPGFAPGINFATVAGIGNDGPVNPFVCIEETCPHSLRRCDIHVARVRLWLRHVTPTAGPVAGEGVDIATLPVRADEVDLPATSSRLATNVINSGLWTKVISSGTLMSHFQSQNKLRLMYSYNGHPQGMANKFPCAPARECFRSAGEQFSPGKRS
jgi:hypothetical protein